MGLFDFFKKSKTRYVVGDKVRIISISGIGTYQLVGTSAFIYKTNNKKYFLNNFEVDIVQFYDLSNVAFDESDLEFYNKEDERDYKLEQLLK